MPNAVCFEAAVVEMFVMCHVCGCLSISQITNVLELIYVLKKATLLAFVFRLQYTIYNKSTGQNLRFSSALQFSVACVEWS